MATTQNLTDYVVQITMGRRAPDGGTQRRDFNATVPAVDAQHAQRAARGLGLAINVGSAHQWKLTEDPDEIVVWPVSVLGEQAADAPPPHLLTQYLDTCDCPPETVEHKALCLTSGDLECPGLTVACQELSLCTTTGCPLNGIGAEPGEPRVRIAHGQMHYWLLRFDEAGWGLPTGRCDAVEEDVSDQVVGLRLRRPGRFEVIVGRDVDGCLTLELPTR